MRLRQRRNESYKNYLDRTIVSNLMMDVKETESIENYKKTLEDNNIDTIEIDFEKENGRKVHIVMSQAQFKALNKIEINKLFKGISRK